MFYVANSDVMYLVTVLSPLIYEQFLLLLLYVDTWMCDESRILDGDTISSVNSYRISSPRENSFLPPFPSSRGSLSI